VKNEKNAENFKIDLSFNNSPKEKIRQILLLFNIEFIVRQYKKILSQKEETENDLFFMKFPFRLFKEENWDIEHIDSYTTNAINKKEEAVEWLENAEADLEKEISVLEPKISSELRGKIQILKEVPYNPKDFDSLKGEFIKIAGEADNDVNLKNSMGNLTLLDAGTNRGYGNALFSTKRRKIIEKEKDGIFIPICTKNVFLKYFDNKGKTRTKWTEDDILYYENQIVEYLIDTESKQKFLTLNANNNE
jgi:hypothetical protein